MAAEHEGMDLRLLGPVRAWRDGTEVALGSARCTAVFTVLALHANRPVSREQLVAAVWGDDPPASATGNVYTYVSALRRVLEPGRDRWAAGRTLTSGAGGYCLHVPGAAVDVHRFEALRERSRRHRAADDRRAELAALEAALGLWRGEALTGMPGRYAEAQRLRLTELRLATAERRATLLIELGRHDEAISALRTLATAYPLQENLHAMLMSALHARGRRAEALEVHDRLRDLLRDETGTEPGAALRAVRSRVLDGGPGGAGPAPAAVFVGRTAELRLLLDAVTEVAAGRGGSVWLKGAPGMGKSALLATALRDAAPPGCRIGWGAGDELARRMPLGVLLECFESAMAGDGSREPVRELFAVAADALGGPAPGIVDRAAAVIRRAAAEGPLILVIDDLELADDATLRVWTELHALTGELPLLLVGAGGPAADDRRLAELRAVHPGEVVLSGLAPADAAALVWRTAPRPPEPRILRRLLGDAGGNPCYLRHLAAAPRREPGDPPPAEVTAAVNAHLGPFAEETRQILRAVAFLGAPVGRRAGCTVPEVAAATGRPADEIRRVLAPAHAAGVLGPGPQLVFRHRIVARTLHEGTPTALRVMLHRSFAEKVAAAGGAPDRVLGQLLAGPAPLDPWAGRWLAGHVEELWASAPKPTIAVLQRAHSQYNLDHGTRLELTAWLARLLFLQGRGAVAEAGWAAARATDPALEAEMRWIVAATHDRRGDHAAAADVARLVLSARRAPGPWLDRFRALLSRLPPNRPPGEPAVPRMRRTAGSADPISVIG
ncbi:BTAD domain-containing putative transcriptional regulator [Actinoplanes sp. NPDC049118]|uniref:BTAD domain-containing putative transcriptional regulator n=1 Tax=Actinoplanes sp. NPDC049118 TaxID=3155769 RepID=UPI0034046F30